MQSIGKSIQLVVFDLDGVLVDSEPLHDVAKRQLLASLGIRGDIDLSWSVGNPQRELWLHFIREYGLSQKPEELERMQYKLIIDQMRDKQIALSVGLIDLMGALKARGLKLAVSSSSDRFYVDRVLEHYQIRSWFGALVGGDEVPRKKPAPDGYLRALELMGVPASAAVAIEDTEAGSRAAKAAGMACIGYRNPTSGVQNLSFADHIVDSLAEVKDVLFPGETTPEAP